MKKRILSLMMALGMCLSVGISAFAADTTKKGNSSIVIENGISYDLSNLKGAAAYFQNHTELVTVNDTVINKDINNLKIYKNTLSDINKRREIDNIISTLKGENTEVQRTSNSTRSITYFNLQTHLDKNTKSMYAEYNISYIAAGGLTQPLVAAPIAYAATGAFFAGKVHSGGDWDYKKNFDRYNSIVKAYIDGRNVSMQAQDVGNIHYGYVGSTYFAPTILKSAAGIAQIAGGHPSWDFSSYFDDPRDQEQIQRGIDYFKTGSFK